MGKHTPIMTVVRLTPAQVSLLARPKCEGHNFIPLYTAGEDRTAKALAAKGLGSFSDFKFQYPWRRRDGYINHFTPKVTQ